MIYGLLSPSGNEIVFIGKPELTTANFTFRVINPITNLKGILYTGLSEYIADLTELNNKGYTQFSDDEDVRDIYRAFCNKDRINPSKSIKTFLDQIVDGGINWRYQNPIDSDDPKYLNVP